MLGHDGFREEFGAVAAALGGEDLVVFAQLDLIVVYSFTQVVRHTVSILDVVQLLQAVDRDREDLTCTLQDR